MLCHSSFAQLLLCLHLTIRLSSLFFTSVDFRLNSMTFTTLKLMRVRVDAALTACLGSNPGRMSANLHVPVVFYIGPVPPERSAALHHQKARKYLILEIVWRGALLFCPILELRRTDVSSVN
jgi:hypothetical protein